MDHFRTTTFILFTLIAGGTGAQAQQQALTWNWANVACSNMLNCNDGCSACNLPDPFANNFHGTNAAWVGVSTCPQPIVAGDNAVFSEGWSAAPDGSKVMMVSGIASSPMALDSIIVRHRTTDQGPTWLRISLKRDLAQPAVKVYEGPIGTEFSELALTGMGCMAIPEGGTASGFQLQFQAYGSDGGAWVLDRVRVVVSPGGPDLSMGTVELSSRRAGRSVPMYDVLGRPADNRTPLGISSDGKCRMMIE